MPLPLAEWEAPRYEVKMQCAATAFETVRFLLRSHAMALYTPFPSRLIQSIYFDTQDGRAAHENISGQATRDKLRFRWYGSGTDTVDGALELKQRDNALVSKARTPLKSIQVSGETRRSLMSALHKQSPPRWQSLLEEGQEPAQWIQYERHYLAARHCPVRVTLDRALRAWDLRDTFILRRAAPTPLPDCIVVECKAPPENFDDIQSIVKSLPVPRTRCSKYLMACMPGHYAI